jgi:putative acetyltransferase
LDFRETSDTDSDEVLRIHRLAFGREDEALLVEKLLHDPSAQPCLSLLAVEGGAGVGHALFTTVGLDAAMGQASCAILAPLAVLPAWQRRGVGRGLIEAGCGRLARRGVGLVFVLGDPGYYTRCGFVPAIPLGLAAPYPIEPEAAWMVRALNPDLLGAVAGRASCAQSLAKEEYWRE